jgi:hypothetical protein
MLLMIGHLAGWLLRLIGESAQQQMSFLFQSTGRTTRKEISVIPLARRTLLYNLQWLSFPILKKALLHLQWQTHVPFISLYQLAFYNINAIIHLW